MNAKERVRYYEVLLNHVCETMDNYKKAVDNYIKVQVLVKELENYLSSGEWQSDYEADEKGAFPADMPRGVLSQDGLYNLLEENGELIKKLLE